MNYAKAIKAQMNWCVDAYCDIHKHHATSDKDDRDPLSLTTGLSSRIENDIIWNLPTNLLNTVQ